MAQEQILVVEDEEDILELITYNLSREGYATTGVTSGEDALVTAKTDVPDLVLLDLMLPGIDGLEVCRELKTEPKTRQTPIIMLTAKGEETDIVAGLELGADDYIVKPFSPRILIARMRAVLRRQASARPQAVTASKTTGNFIINPDKRTVHIGGMNVDLTNMEFRVLHFLSLRPGWVYTRSQIVDAARGENYPVTDRSVDVLVVGLRKKLGSCAHYIETVRGVGYRFRDA